ncbi:MAG: hypothetical protein OQK57_10315 [Ignavibacteriaceae bacterium]|nr:hypothetical protein [Ignavibacteriaceae bacterium]
MKIFKDKINIVTLLSGLTLFVYNCSETINQPIADEALKYIYGRIENYDLGDSVIIKFERRITLDSIFVFDTSEVNTDGSFILEMKEPLNSFLSFRNGMQCAGLSFSDSTVRTYAELFFHLYKNNKILGGVIGANKEYGNEYEGGDYYTALMYTEKKLQVEGICEGSSGGKDYLMIHKFSLLAGWNKIIVKIEINNDTLIVDKRTINNNFNNTWYYWLY